MKQIVAIDGPSGSGKSTVAALLAKKLGYLHLDTGAMYRAVALAAVMEDIAFDDADALDELCSRIQIEMLPGPDGVAVQLNGKDVTSRIRSPEMSLGSSTVSSVPQVRSHMVRIQRRLGKDGGVVAEGRDMGTVVFPRTKAKFYLDASTEERARRRWIQLKDMGLNEDQDTVRSEMEERDRMDSSRSHSPLHMASDAKRVDTTAMSIEEVVDCLMRNVKELEQVDA